MCVLTLLGRAVLGAWIPILMRIERPSTYFAFLGFEIKRLYKDVDVLGGNTAKQSEERLHDELLIELAHEISVIHVCGDIMHAPENCGNVFRPHLAHVSSEAMIRRRERGGL